MSGNHTPTPWRLIEEEERGARIVSEVQDVVIATVWPFMRAHGDLPALANAELIVTAVNSYASSQAEIERLTTLEAELWRLSLVIESAVRNADRPNHAEVLALIKSIKRPDASLSGSKE